MWAYQLTGPRTLERVVVASPSPSELSKGDIVARVLAGGVCGSDVPYFVDGPPAATLGPPGYPMHEFVGEVVASNDETIVCGDVVVGWAQNMAGMAELDVTRGDWVVSIEGTWPPDRAIVVQPLACVLAALSRLSVYGKTVAVIGQGSIGMLFSHALASNGAKQVIGVDRVDRSDFGSTFGVSEVVGADSTAWAAALSRDRRPEIVIEAVGHQGTTLGDAVTAVAEVGEIYYFGIPPDIPSEFPLHQFLRKSLTLQAGVTTNRRKHLGDAVEYVRLHPDVLHIVTHIFDISDAQDAYLAAAEPTKGKLKVALRF
jgi:L-iditol 2-dehydrogenase